MIRAWSWLCSCTSFKPCHRLLHSWMTPMTDASQEQKEEGEQTESASDMACQKVSADMQHSELRIGPGSEIELDVCGQQHCVLRATCNVIAPRGLKLELELEYEWLKIAASALWSEYMPHASCHMPHTRLDSNSCLVQLPTKPKTQNWSCGRG
ncbi:hypothetical protein ACLKA6_000308 [Drosophila palustris]